MIIKKFQGKTEEEAIESAKKELGNAIVIMNVRNVKQKGLFRFFGAQRKEVTVALEEEAASQIVAQAAPPQKEQVAEKSDFSSNTLQRPQNSGDDFKSAVAAVSEIARQQVAMEKREKKQDFGAALKKDAAVENALPEKADTDQEIGQKLDHLQTLLKQQMNAPIEKQAMDEKKEDEQNSNVPFYKLLYQIMLENEIDEKYVNQLIDDLDKTMKPNMPIDFMLSNIYQKMVLKFGQTSFITPAEKGPKFVYFIGPTGVGKTTTIAKIASKFCVDEKKKVALLTADTYRIAAAEQLRTYANILEVPFRVIYTPAEVEKAFEDFHEYDYILVDTAGHSHHNTSQRNAMSEFVHALDYRVEKEVYLVVSATTKYRDLISIADTYKEMTEYKLIFTKLDETTTLGNLLNVRLYTGAPMSYITCGQNVPDDIDQFNAQETVKKLLGGNHMNE